MQRSTLTILICLLIADVQHWLLTWVHSTCLSLMPQSNVAHFSFTDQRSASGCGRWNVMPVIDRSRSFQTGGKRTHASFYVMLSFFIGKAFKLNIKHIRALFRAFKSVWRETEKKYLLRLLFTTCFRFHHFPSHFSESATPPLLPAQRISLERWWFSHLPTPGRSF